MWQDSKDGISKEFITKQKETVLFEIKRKSGVGVIHREGKEQIICGLRDQQVKIWNDMVFDTIINDQIKSKMNEVFKKSKSSKR